MTEVTLHLDGDPVVKERDFYQAKLKEANERIRSLEYDNAELVKRDKELSERVRYMASNPPRRPRRSNYVRH
tara:strand:- start:506 stop:721 length:216 start_codon:yes stop_codon:yes gene_type:complete